MSSVTQNRPAAADDRCWTVLVFLPAVLALGLGFGVILAVVLLPSRGRLAEFGNAAARPPADRSPDCWPRQRSGKEAPP